MANAKRLSNVTVHFTGKFQDGEVFISSRDTKPFQFVIGKGQMMKGLEDAVVGMTPGTSKTVTIPAASAFGEHRPDLFATIDKSNFPEGVEPKVKMRLKVPRPSGGEMFVTITEVTDTTVTVDANHPFAGKDVTFDIQLLKVE